MSLFVCLPVNDQQSNGVLSSLHLHCRLPTDQMTDWAAAAAVELLLFSFLSLLTITCVKSY